MHSYDTNDMVACLESHTVIFVGDSAARKAFEGLARIVEPALPQREDSERHVDRFPRHLWCPSRISLGSLSKRIPYPPAS